MRKSSFNRKELVYNLITGFEKDILSIKGGCANAKDQGMGEEAYFERRKKRCKQQADMQIQAWDSSTDGSYRRGRNNKI